MGSVGHRSDQTHCLLELPNGAGRDKLRASQGGVSVKMLKGPFIPVTTAYIAGLLLGNWLPAPLALLFSAWALALIGAAVWPRRSAVLLAVALVQAGWTNLVARTALLSPADLRAVLAEEPQLGTIRGRLAGTPTQRVVVRGKREARRTSVMIDVQAVRIDDGWRPAIGRVAATMSGALETGYFGGRTVEVVGVLRRPSGPVAEGLFDHRAWLEWQGIHYELVTDGPEDWALVATADEPVRPPLSDRFLAWAQGVLAIGQPEEDEALRLLWAMTLGWKTALTDEASEPFVRTGTMHIFAISGLHIVLITGILVALLRVMQVPRCACGAVTVPIVWFYTAATGWQASAIRATLMMTVIIGGWALRRPSDLLNSLAAAGFMILIWEPRQLFQASFQLSFFVVLAIALFARPIAEVQRRWLATDPFLPEELVPRWRKALEPPLRWLAVSLGTSTAAWLGSWPWIARYFHIVTPGGLVSNLVIVPVSSLALMSNLGGLICGTWLRPLTELFNQSAWFWMSCVIRVSEWMAAQPWTWFHARSPGIAATMAYYALLFGVMMPELRRNRRWTLTLAVPALWLALEMAVGWWAARDTLTLTVLALRSGAAQYVDAPGRSDDLLIDCGDAPSAKAAVGPFLESRGVNCLARLAVTHGDVRHVGGAQMLADAFRARQIVASGAPSRSPDYRRLLQSLESTPERRVWAKAGDMVAGWTVLHPAADERHAQADDNALVLSRTFGGVRILLLGDLGVSGQAALLERGADLRADIVIAGLPAKGEPLGQALVEAIQPRLIVIQDAEYPANERAGASLRARLELWGAPVLCTTVEGTITVRVRCGRWQARTMRGRSVEPVCPVTPGVRTAVKRLPCAALSRQSFSASWVVLEDAPRGGLCRLRKRTWPVWACARRAWRRLEAPS